MGIVQPNTGGERNITMQIAVWSTHFNFSGTRTASACSSSLFSEHNTRDSHSTASLSSHCFEGLFSGWHCYLWWLQNLGAYPCTLNNDPSFTWQDGCNYVSSQEGSCWLRKVSNFPGFLQWYLPDKPTNFSDGSQHNTAVRMHWSRHLCFVLSYSRDWPATGPFCSNFSRLPIQIKAKKLNMYLHTQWIQVLRTANTHRFYFSIKSWRIWKRWILGQWGQDSVEHTDT